MKMVLTDGVSAEDGVRGHARQPAASGVHGDDPELVHGTLQQAGNVPVVAQWQRPDGITTHAAPTLGGGLLLLDEVAGDGRAAIILGFVPVDSH